MQQNDKDGYLLVDRALRTSDIIVLKQWIDHVVSYSPPLAEV